MDKAEQYHLEQAKKPYTQKEYDFILGTLRLELKSPVISDVDLAILKVYLQRRNRFAKCWLTDVDAARLIVERFPQYTLESVEVAYRRFWETATPPAGSTEIDAGNRLSAALTEVVETFNLKAID